MHYDIFKDKNKLNEFYDEMRDDAMEEKEMMMRQLHFIEYAAQEIVNYVEMVDNPEEWFQNKLSGVFEKIRGLHSYIEGDKRMMQMDIWQTAVKEETQLDENGFLLKYIADKSKKDSKQILADLKKHLGFSKDKTIKDADPLVWDIFWAKDQQDMQKAQKRLASVRGSVAADRVKNATRKVITEENLLNEVLKASDPIETWIRDFIDSDNPRFEGKTKEERIEMAKGAYYAAQREKNESTEITENQMSYYIYTPTGRKPLEESLVHMGKTYKSAKAFKTEKEANAFLEKNSAYGFVTEKGGKFYVAKHSDKGVKEEVELDEKFSVFKNQSPGAGQSLSNKVTVKSFKTKDAMDKFISTGSNSLQWTKTGVEGLKSGTYRMKMVRGKDGKPAREFIKEEVEYANIGGARVKNDEKSILKHFQKTFPNIKKIKKDTQHGWVPVFEEFEEELDQIDESIREYVDTVLGRSLKNVGATVSKKFGYTSYSVNGYTIVNDGVGISVKKNGKEIKYFGKPKLDYKKVIDMVKEEIELDEAMDDVKKAMEIGASEFKKGKKRVPGSSSALMKMLGGSTPEIGNKHHNKLMKAWLKGWDSENMKEEVELDESIREYVDTVLGRSLKNVGATVSKKIGYTSYSVNGYKIVNDGVGISVEKDGKEIKYFGKPKLDYKKVIDMVKEEIELDEAMDSFIVYMKDGGKTVVKARNSQEAIKKLAKRRGEDWKTMSVKSVVKEEMELDEAKDYMEISKEIKAYANKRATGVDKEGMMKVAAALYNIGKDSSSDAQARHYKTLMKAMNDMDTDPRDGVAQILKKHGMVKGGRVVVENVEEESKSLDAVNKEALKKKFKNRKDKDIDNDGDVDDSDEYLHNRRQVISKNIDET